MGLESVFKSTIKWAQKSGIAYESFEEISSTNTIAKEKAFSDSTLAYFADHQLQGRGRGVNTWSDSGRGQSLAMTLKFHLKKAPQPILSPLVGLALYGAATHAFPALNFSLKPPNDLFLQNKKVAGLLIETVAKGSQYCLIVGLGMNVLSAPADLPLATYLCGELGFNKRIDEVVWFEFLTKLKSLVERYIPFGIDGRLPPTEKSTLLSALNAFPLLKDEYVDLTDTGDLSTRSNKISWKDI